MITDRSQFKINSPDVVSETIDGEAVIVSLSRGTYYSLDQVGVEVWDLVGKGFSTGKILTALVHKFEGDAQIIESSVKELIAQLQAEHLITMAGEATAGEATAGESAIEEDSTPSSLESSSAKVKFVPPALQKYSDMVDLLMVDPIHEVDETQGWPVKREETAA